jgi:hypothetical protein
VGTAGCWHARRVKAGALRRRGGVSGPVVHYACPRGGGRGPRAGGIAHARQPAGCTVVPEGLPFGGAPAGGGEGEPVGWVALVGWAAAAASGGRTDHAVGGVDQSAAERELASRQVVLSVSWRQG